METVMEEEIEQQASEQEDKGTLGIIAGKGSLPARIISACRTQERDVFVLAFEDETDATILEYVPHAYIRHGAVGEAINHLRKAGAKQLVMAGRIERPSLSHLRPDGKGTKLLARLGKSLFAGDDRLLSTIVTFLEEEGLEVVGVEDVLDDVLTPEGMIGNVYPDKQSQADIEQGARVAKALGEQDVGQAVIVQKGYVLGVEAIEGTDGLIERCAGLKVADRGGVLIKVKKPGQEGRVDLPTIGVKTVQNVAAAGFAGIALEAGSSLILDRKHVAFEANKHNIFVIGFTSEEV